MRPSFIKTSPIWFTLSGCLVAASIVLLIYPGMKLGLDFTGGTLLELHFEKEVSVTEVGDALQNFASEQEVDVGAASVIKTTENGFIIRIRDITNEEHLSLSSSLTEKIGPFTESRFITIGPTVGRTLTIRSITALAVATALMVLFIALAFRNMPRKLNPWKFGLVAMFALIHDVLITLGTFALLSHLTSFEMDTLFVTALLIIIGYSVSDTIVIFDRIREHVFLRERGEDFSETAERALWESIPRSINTSLSSLIPLTALFILGGDSIRWFVLALLVGLSVGTYSSIFLATPLLVFWRKK